MGELPLVDERRQVAALLLEVVDDIGLASQVGGPAVDLVVQPPFSQHGANALAHGVDGRQVGKGDRSLPTRSEMEVVVFTAGSQCFVEAPDSLEAFPREWCAISPRRRSWASGAPSSPTAA